MSKKKLTHIRTRSYLKTFIKNNSKEKQKRKVQNTPTHHHAPGDDPRSLGEVEEHGHHVLQAPVEVAYEQQHEDQVGYADDGDRVLELKVQPDLWK